MRRAILVMTDFLVLDILKATLSTDRRIISIVKNALPDDVKIVRVGHDRDGTLRFVLESEEFEEVKDDKQYPYLPCPEIKVEYI